MLWPLLALHLPLTPTPLPAFVRVCCPLPLPPHHQQPQQAYISTGAGVKALVSDSQLLGVLDAIKPALKHKRYACSALSIVSRSMQGSHFAAAA